MKPEGPVARRADYEVRACPHREALALISEHHYAKGASNTSVAAHCLVRKSDNKMVGAALWMPPTKRAAQYTANLFGDKTRWQEVLSLSRLVVAPGEPKNAAGMLLGATTRLVQRDRRWAFAVTFADTWRGHQGTIYRATGWTPAGETEATPCWVDESGKMVARKATKNRKPAEMTARGCKLLGKFSKHRFTKRLRR